MRTPMLHIGPLLVLLPGAQFEVVDCSQVADSLGARDLSMPRLCTHGRGAWSWSALLIQESSSTSSSTGHFSCNAQGKGRRLAPGALQSFAYGWPCSCGPSTAKRGVRGLSGCSCEECGLRWLWRRRIRTFSSILYLASTRQVMRRGEKSRTEENKKTAQTVCSPTAERVRSQPYCKGLGQVLDRFRAGFRGFLLGEHSALFRLAGGNNTFAVLLLWVRLHFTRVDAFKAKPTSGFSS